MITITTDFGEGDYEAGLLRGVIWRIAPEVQVVDLTHSVTPQDILEGALLLGRCTPYFTDETIHMAVVDPGVGTQRRGLAARLGRQYFVGPDNGLFTLMLQKAETENLPVQFVSLENPRYWLPEVSPIFHGRDIFAPVAAHLAAGLAIDQLGPSINDPIRLFIPTPQKSGHGWQAQVLHVDSFGNLAVNLGLENLQNLKNIRIEIKNTVINSLVKTFSDGKPGDLVALMDSSNHLSICIVNGSAAKFLGVGAGEPVSVEDISSQQFIESKI